MNRIILKNLWRFLFLMVVQVLVLKRINLGGESFNYISIYIYPLFLMFLPFRLPQPILILIGFLTGLMTDIAYNSPGLHAGASVFSTFARPFILNIIEPASEYNEDFSPTKRHYGIPWFIQYSALYLFLHLIFYFSIEVFTFVYIKEILLRTLLSFLVSWVLILVYTFIFDPAE